MGSLPERTDLLRYLWSVGYAKRIFGTDILLAKFREVFVFFVDILIVTKGTKENHLDKVRESLKILDRAKLQLKAGKGKIAKQEIE